MSLYPAAYDLSLPAPVDNTTALLAVQGNAWSDALYNLEHAVGLSGDTASSTGTIYAKIAYLLAAGGGIFKQTTAPSSPATDDLWLDTDDTRRPLYDFRSGTWALIGANALEYSGLTIDSTAPGTDGMVPSWDVASTSIKWRTPAGGMANPLTAQYALLVGGAVSGGVAAPAQFAIGTTVGQMLGVVAGPALGWITPSFVPAPAGAQQGDVLYYTGSAWARLAAGSSGQFLKTLGASANPAWATPPSAAPGDGIPAPVGQVQGDILYFDGVDWLPLHAGTSGQFLKTNGASANPSWASPATGLTNPLTSTGDVIYSSDGSGTPARLGIGSTGQALIVSAGAPSWQTWNPMTTQDDLIIGGSSGAVARLAKGSDSQVLTISASTHHVVWANNSAGFADPTSTRGDLIYHGNTGTTRLALGSSGYALLSNGTDAAWGAIYGDPLTTRGDLVVRGASATGRLALGTTGFYLKSDGTDAVWAAIYNQTVAKAGSAATQRPTVNLIDGDGMAITVADNSGSSRTDVTVAARWSRALAFA